MNLPRAWERLWFRPAQPTGVIVCRVVVALNALWIVLSRPDLPEVLYWPPVFWNRVSPALRGRFLLYPMAETVEKALYALLVLSLLTAAAGFFPRVTCFLSAVLLYRFAPLESIFTIGSGPHFRGLTVPAVILFLLAFCEVPRLRAGPSSEFRWPLMLARVFVANIYVSSGLPKFWNVGPHWFTADYFTTLVRSMALPEFTPPWAQLWATHSALAWAGAVGALVLDFAILLPLFFPRTSWIVIPIMVLGHILIWKVFGVIFLSTPLLLLFFPWEERAMRSVDANLRSV